MLLISDTNASIKLSAFGNKFFTNGVLVDELGSCCKTGKKELKGLQKAVGPGQLLNCINIVLKEMSFYDFDQYTEFEFWDFLARFYNPAEKIVCEEQQLSGCCDNDKYFMHLAVTYNDTLVTNDLPLYYLAKKVKELGEVPDMEEFDVVTVEDLVLKAFDDKKLTKLEVQNAIKIWNATNRSVLKHMVPEFENRNLL